MENIEQNELEEKKIDSQNPKLQVVKSKNQIDFFMHNYAVYKKSGVVVMEVIFQTPNGDESHYYELTKEEIEEDEFRAVANAIRKEPQKFADRELV
ncbi:MAG: hypothetical protein J6U13_06205 [Salinivirgaceae bacterium]|nr:hypothetical protein [Salinivirgaceae bacterium]